MVRRLRRGLPLLAAGLLMQTGCVATSLWEGGAPALSGNDAAVKAGNGLPVKESTQLHLNLADKFQKTGNLGEAAAQLEMIRKENPAAGKDVDHRLAILYGEVGKPQKALEELQKLLASNPRDVDLLNDLGQCYYDLGSWSQAEKFFRQALDVNPQYQRGWVNLGLTLGQEEHYDEARDAFLKAVSPAEAECNLGFVYLTQGKRSEAREAYQRAVTADPTSRFARAALQKLDAGGSAPDLVRPTAELSLPEPAPEPSQPDQ